MKRKRHSRADILLKVREANDHLAAGVPLEEIQRKQQVSLQTLQRWLRDYGGLQPESLSRLTQLEQENRRLRKAVTSLESDKKILSEAVRGNF
jgi:putative transposase